LIRVSSVIFQGDVEVDANERALPREIELVDGPHLHRYPSLAFCENSTRKPPRRQRRSSPITISSAISRMMIISSVSARPAAARLLRIV
jgi:hypothetical protein